MELKRKIVSRSTLMIYLWQKDHDKLNQVQLDTL